MTKAMKKVLSVVLSIAMIATSVTITQKTAKAAEELTVTAAFEAGSVNQIRVNWTNPADVVANAGYTFGYYVNEIGDNTHAIAANGWDWTANSNTEIRTMLDTVKGTNGGLVFDENGGDFSIIVVIYKDGEVYAQGTSNTITVEKYQNTNTNLNLRTTGVGSATTIEWDKIGDANGKDATSYVVTTSDGSVNTTVQGTTCTYSTPATQTENDTNTYSVTVTAYSGNDVITTTNGTVSGLAYFYDTGVAPAEHTSADFSNATWEKVGADNDGNEYYINDDHTLSKGVWYKIYTPHSTADYHGERNKCILGDASSFTFQHTEVKEIWVNGTKYGNPSTAFNNQGDCCELSCEVLETGINVITLVHNNDSTVTFGMKVQGEQAPDQSYAPVNDWVAVGTADNGNKFYVSDAFKTANINAVIYGLYNPATTAPYSPATNTVTGGSMSFAMTGASGVVGSMSAVWVDGVKYGNRTESAFMDGDQFHISQNVFALGTGVTEKEFAVTIVGAANCTFAVKVVAPAEETAPDQTLTGFTWESFTGGVYLEPYGPEVNPITDKDGNKVYISSNAIDKETGFFKTADIYGLYDDAAHVPYIPSTKTVTGPTLSFAITSANVGTMTSVWVDGVRYANKTENVFLDGDQVHLSQNLIALGANETEKITYITVRGDVDNTFAIKVEKPSKYEVSIDGTKVADVTEGDTYTLPTTAQFGYFVGDDLYKAGAQVVVNGDIDFTSLNSVAVEMANGAVVKNAAPAGIAFQATVTVNENEEAVDAAFLSTGMLITANDLFVELGGSELALDSDYTFKNVENTGWFAGNTGTYRAGITGVTSDNYIRKFIARGYAKLTYTDGTDTVVYSAMSPVRSIQQVAQAAIDANQGNDFLAECAAAN